MCIALIIHDMHYCDLTSHGRKRAIGLKLKYSRKLATYHILCNILLVLIFIILKMLSFKEVSPAFLFAYMVLHADGKTSFKVADKFSLHFECEKNLMN